MRYCCSPRDQQPKGSWLEMGFRPQYAAAWAFHHRRKCRPRQVNLAVGENNDMNIEAKYAGLEVGYDVPALPGMSEDEIQTPCLILDLDALERNIRKMGDYARAHNMRHRAHGKMHKSVDELSAAAEKHGTILECFVEFDCGAGRCGVNTAAEVVAIAKAIEAAPGLKFTGIQAYQGAMQHLERYEDRKAKLDAAIAQVEEAVEALKKEGLKPEVVSGGGTGSYYFESGSGVYNELQCGSYAFMDADYGRILDKDGKRIDKGEWKNALFILTSVMSHTKADKAICDAGLKAQSVDSGLPFVYGRDDVQYVKCSDEHGVIDDPNGVLKINEKLRLVPGHCDPTCNVHDWYVGIRKGKVETLWPVSARRKAY